MASGLELPYEVSSGPPYVGVVHHCYYVISAVTLIHIVAVATFRTCILTPAEGWSCGQGWH